MRADLPSRLWRRAAFALAALALALGPPTRADEIGDALDASIAAQRAAKESQQRVDKLDDEAKKLREQRRQAEWKALQMSAYADQLEEQAQVEEHKRADIEVQLERIRATGTDLLPLMKRMVADLDGFVSRDLPFLQEQRRQRVRDLTALLDDPQRGNAEKFRRVMEAYRTEVEYGHSLGSEDGEAECNGPREKVSLVRIGRVALYCLSDDGERAGWWDGQRWQPLTDSDDINGVRKARAVAKGEAAPELLEVPMRAPKALQ